MARTTWRKLISDSLKENRDDWENLVAITLSEDELDREFDDGYGGTEGRYFTAWTEDNVYFPIVYDGGEWCGRVPRHPNGEALEHQGGY